MLLMNSRLQIKPVAPWHAEALFQALDFDSVYEFLNSNRPETVAEMSATIDRYVAGPSDGSEDIWLNFVVLIGNQIIGCTQATIVGSRSEIAYLFSPVVVGQGYATRATEWLINYVTETHGISKFWATTDPRNERSISLLKRCDFIETSLPEHGLRSYDDGDLVFTLGQ